MATNRRRRKPERRDARPRDLSPGELWFIQFAPSDADRDVWTANRRQILADWLADPARHYTRPAPWWRWPLSRLPQPIPSAAPGPGDGFKSPTWSDQREYLRAHPELLMPIERGGQNHALA